MFVFLLPYVCACLWGHVGEETEVLRQAKLQAESETAEDGCRMQALMSWGVWELPLEEYLVYKLEAVMPESYEREALKAQAVLLRTEVIQVMQEQESERLQVSGEGLEKWYEADSQDRGELQLYRRAVEETAGLYLCYEGEPIQVSYFKISNGQTRDAGEVWETEKCPYLTSVSCVQDKAASDYFSEVTVSRVNFLHEIQARMEEDCEPQELWEGMRLDYDGAGYVTNVSFYAGEKEIGRIDGETFRYLFALPSASFETEQGEGQMTFHVKGVGHGFGMSQYGANCRALNGETYDQILKDFFVGTELAKFE